MANSLAWVVARQDPYFSSVVLLALNDNKGDATTTFTDQAKAPHALTANGNVQYDTDQAPVGMTSSALLDGTGDFISTVDSNDWNVGSGDFTIEQYVNFDSSLTLASTTRILEGQWGNAGVRAQLLFWQKGSWKWAYTADGTNATIPAFADTISVSTWYHVALVRSGSSVFLFRDGAQIGATHTIGTTVIFDSTAAFVLGRNLGDTTQDWFGWQASTRVTRGIARYTGTFTPPTLPLPNL